MYFINKSVLLIVGLTSATVIPSRYANGNPSARPLQSSAVKYTAKCIGVSDGDTLTVLNNRKQIRIRLYGIDAPERHQAFGQQAKNALSKAAFGKNVIVYPKETDQYGRTLAWVFVGDSCLNRELVENDMAWHYARYAPNESRLASLQSQARARRIGLWSAPATPPWTWRKKG